MFAEWKFQILTDGHRVVERGVLKYVADVPSDAIEVAGFHADDFLAFHSDAAGIGG